jgi:hypothetical protein
LTQFNRHGGSQLAFIEDNETGSYQAFFRLLSLCSNVYAIQYRLEGTRFLEGVYRISIQNATGQTIFNNNSRNETLKPYSKYINSYSRLFNLLSRGENIVPSAGVLGKLVDGLPGITWRIPQKLKSILQNYIEPYVVSEEGIKYLVFHPLATRCMGDNIREYVFANQKVECLNPGLLLSVNSYGAPCVEGTILISEEPNKKGGEEEKLTGAVSKLWPHIHSEWISLLGMEGTWAFTTCWKNSQSAIFRNPSYHSLWSTVGVEFEALNASYDPLLFGLFDLLMEILIETQNENGWWDSDDISTPMRVAFGETPGRLDDRRSTNAAWALYRWSREKDRAEAREASVKYLFAIEQLLTNGYLFEEPNGGFLIPDYYHPDFHRKPYASLNHNLNLANYCAHVSLVDEEEEVRMVAKDLAEGIYSGIKETGQKWLQPNGDLTYALYYPPGLAPSNDYPTLTYHDLSLTKFLVKYMKHSVSGSIEMLLEAKRAFLKKRGYRFLGPYQLPPEPGTEADPSRAKVFRAGTLDDIKNSISLRRDA